MKNFISIDNLPKCLTKRIDYREPIWNKTFIKWYDDNQDLIKNFHQNYNCKLDQYHYALEFFNAEDLTIFVLQFS